MLADCIYLHIPWAKKKVLIYVFLWLWLTDLLWTLLTVMFCLRILFSFPAEKRKIQACFLFSRVWKEEKHKRNYFKKQLPLKNGSRHMPWEEEFKCLLISPRQHRAFTKLILPYASQKMKFSPLKTHRDPQILWLSSIGTISYICRRPEPDLHKEMIVVTDEALRILLTS